MLASSRLNENGRTVELPHSMPPLAHAVKPLMLLEVMARAATTTREQARGIRWLACSLVDMEAR